MPAAEKPVLLVEDGTDIVDPGGLAGAAGKQQDDGQGGGGTNDKSSRSRREADGIRLKFY
jgi:hypothetical protein